MMTPPRAPGLLGWFDHPYVLMFLTAAMWAGNSVAGRLISGHASPMVVTGVRWWATLLALSLFALPQLRRDWPVLRPWLPRLIGCGILGYTGFNALFYRAAHDTTAINISIIQGSIPLFVFLFMIVLAGYRPTRGQLAGTLLGLCGVIAIATGLDAERVRSLGFNRGDLIMLVASLFYAGYTFLIRRKPPVSAFSFFAVMAVTAAVTSLPLMLAEHAAGALQWPTPRGWLILLYITVFPSFLSQIFFIRAVQQIGPGRAGMFTNLVPVLGTFAGPVIGETVGLPQILGLVLVVGGILWAEQSRSR